ncbi:MAG: ATP-binding cassette domain-containing protein [Bacteroidaceae bacterium]|nr:ATP-binding cassette domain-containing protein [Bacteroidaceae bacterium]
MNYGKIIIRGARENNLKNVSLEIPKHQITVFTGVSGSGKSSLVLDTIAAKSRRELNDTFPTFVQQYLPKYGRPHVDAIENLPIAIVIDQKKPGNNSRSTVGTYTDIYALLRLLFSRVGQPFVGYAESFSFNHPEGSCPRCSGLGEIRELDIHKLVDFDKSLNDEDTIHYIAFGKGGWRWIRYAHSGLFDLDKKIKDYSPEELDLFLNSPQIRLKNPPANWPKSAKYEGLIPRMYRSIINSEEGLLHAAALNPMLRMGTCPDCGGTRVCERVRTCKIEGKDITEACAMSITRLNAWIRTLSSPLAVDLKAAISARLTALEEIGLGYLSLDRAVGTLSGGEAQRCKIAKYINSSLADVLYILDEPSTGLHNRDIELMKHSVRRLRDAGNTVLLVEHHREMIGIADHVVDIGPGPGIDGGRIVYEGTYEGLLRSGTATGEALKGGRSGKNASPRQAESSPEAPSATPPIERTPQYSAFTLKDASLHNLRHITIQLPMAQLVVIAGVAGSGKSSLMECFRRAYPTPSDIVYISQKDIGVSLRSTPATYMDVAPDIRKLFARQHHLKEAYFTFNGKGACPVCGGKGVIISEMAFMDNIETTCEACGGLRFSKEALEYKIKWSAPSRQGETPSGLTEIDSTQSLSPLTGAVGDRALSIAEVFDLSVRLACDFFRGTTIEQKLRPLMDVGLGYLHLNQALSTLSGGELQRLKMASYLGEKGKIFIIDEPTDGLHLKDVHHILRLFRRMVDEGNTVYVIEHNTDVIRAADHVVELGPGAGEAGGQIIFEGSPEAMRTAPQSVTAPYL